VLGVNDNETYLPGEYYLANNYPNPFNPTTTIEYSTPVTGQVKLTIYNILGEQVGHLVNEIQPAGDHSVTFDASGIASGMYFYQLEGSNFLKSKKMILLK